jgi:hypothetical protein
MLLSHGNRVALGMALLIFQSGISAKTIAHIAIEFAGAKNKGALSRIKVAQSPNNLYGTAVLKARIGPYCFFCDGY